MSIKNPVKTFNLQDFGEIASPAKPLSESATDKADSKSKKANPSTGSFEQQVEDEINLRVKKEKLK